MLAVFSFSFPPMPAGVPAYHAILPDRQHPCWQIFFLFSADAILPDRQHPCWQIFFLFSADAGRGAGVPCHLAGSPAPMLAVFSFSSPPMPAG
ncbi:MAG: hypothetical protein A2X45_09960 [Lentisphaerae bacterium GWF2_50_93]|nr:MAG: hypothetical protein A2X45_09960 [Lentisphaerae bacterium GWF2_50_93]